MRTKTSESSYNSPGLACSEKLRNVDLFRVIQPKRYQFTEIITIKSKKTGIIHKHTGFVP